MAESTQKKTSTISISSAPSPPPPPPPYKPKNTSSTSFLACFRFSRKVRRSTTSGSNSKSSHSFLRKNETNYIRSDRHHEDAKKINMKRSDRRWSLIPRSSWFGTNNKSATKTVPVVETSGTLTPKKERPSKVNAKFSSETKKSKSKSGELVSAATGDGLPPPALLDVHTTPPTPKPPQTNTINLENRIHLEPSKDDTCQNRLSFCWKIVSIRTKATTPRSAGGGKGGGVFRRRSQPGSPPVHQEEKKPKSTTRTTTAAAEFSHSVSFPAPNLQIAGPAAAVAEATTSPSAHNNNRTSSWSWSNSVSNTAPSINKKVDPLVGMSIIMVTLIIMLVWGRLCAILCTSAWFYFLPRLRSRVPAFGASHGSGRGDQIMVIPRDLDFNSEEYKKKVVLEGFLERNRRNIP